MRRLETRMAEWFSKGQRMGDIFVEIAGFLKVYTPFVNSYNSLVANISDLKQTSPEFKAHLEVEKRMNEFFSFVC